MKISNRKLVYGVGINDADYPVYKYEKYVNSLGKKCTKTVWECPYYKIWCSMLQRACCEKFKKKFPTYSEVSVSEEWKTFSNFRSWMQYQIWEDMELDKDFLSKGKKIYSAETCVFIPQFLNCAFNANLTSKDLPVGVTRSNSGKFLACVNRQYLGIFPSPMAAHFAWQKGKVTEIRMMMKQYKTIKGYDRDVIEALNCISINIEKESTLGIQTVEYKNTLE